MNSIAFPNMFSSTKTNLLSDREATMNNLQLLLLSDRWSLFGDPYYGTSFKRAIFEQNNVVIRDLIIDEIYNVILLFMPQLRVTRKDIKIVSRGAELIAEIKCTYREDGTSDLFALNMTANDTTQL